MKKTLLLIGLTGFLSWHLNAAAQSYLPVGPQTNVPVTTVTGGGWMECYQDTYDTPDVDLAGLLANCEGTRLMLACRPNGNSTLTVLAQAPREDVLFDTGTGNTPHNANGTGWYFNNDWSWGFADEGDVLDRGECDTETSGNNDQRLCWHVFGSQLQSGWRCGVTTSLNDADDWDRIIYTAGTGAIPTLSWLGLGLLALVLGGVAWRRLKT